MINVLVVEDSPVVRNLLVYILNSDPDVRVVATASDGNEALAAAQSTRPSVITMDIHMPGVDGFDATRQIMETCPTPIVIVSGSSSKEETAWAFRAMEAGALAVVEKPLGPGTPGYEESAQQLLGTVKLMSEVKVVRRWARSGRTKPRETRFSPAHSEEVRLVAIGASTGGPPVLQAILSRLPRDFPVPVVVVQHMAAGFIEGFAEWLGQTCQMRVLVAAQGTQLLPGHVYIAPDGREMKISERGTVLLTLEGSQNHFRPSVASLFRSVAEAYGSKAMGVLLTGMGKDGASELKLMRERGAVTIAQDSRSSVVYGMPGEAVRIGAAAYELSPEQIASALLDLGRDCAIRRRAKQSEES